MLKSQHRIYKRVERKINALFNATRCNQYCLQFIITKTLINEHLTKELLQMPGVNENLIDVYLDEYWERHKIAVVPIVN